MKTEQTTEDQGAVYLCRCDCGNEVIATESELLNGIKTSCGQCSVDNEKTNMNTEAKNQTHHQDTERPEPFTTILDLLREYSKPELLEAISDAALFDSEDEAVCSTCRTLAARLFLELDQLLDRMSAFEDAVLGADDEADQTTMKEQPSFGVVPKIVQ